LNNETIDKLADEKFSQSEAGRELTNMNTQTGKIAGDEDLVEHIDFRQIKESLKNSNAFRESLNKLNSNGITAPPAIDNKIQSAQKKLRKLKNKYSRLPSSVNTAGSEKRNSLKNTPFRKRIVLGGQVRIVTLKPFSIDAEPMAGYRINKLLRAGISGKYSFSTSRKTLPSGNLPEPAIGYGIFAEHTVYKGFFAHLQLERNIGIKANDNKTNYQWHNGLLLGIGKEYYITKKIHGTCLALYDTLKKKKQPGSSPWQFRVGIVSGF